MNNIFPMTRKAATSVGEIGNLLLIVSLLFFGVTAAVAQPVLPPEGLPDNATLENYLLLAAQNNPGLQAAFNRWKAALEEIPQVRALPDPTFTFAYFIREVETRVGPQRGRVEVMQMFPWFGKLKLKGNAAMEAANAEKQRYENTKLALFYTVKNAYYQYYLVNRSIELLTENIHLLQSLESVLLSKYSSGTTPYSTLLKLQVELDKLQDQLASKKDLLAPVSAQLNAALNRQPDLPLPVPDAIVSDLSELSHPSLVEQLKKNNPGLKAMDAMTEMGQTRIQLARKNYSPDFSLGLSYIVTGPTVMPGVADSGKDPIAVMMSLRIPIWGKKNRAAVNAAAAGYRAALNDRQESENKLLTQLEMVYYQLRDARRKMTLYKDILVPRAQQMVEVTRSAFEAGKTDFMDVIDSQRILLAFQLEYENALTQQAQRLAELHMLVGNDALGEDK